MEQLVKVEQPKTPMRQKVGIAKKAMRILYLSKLKPILLRGYDSIRWINRMPFAVLFCIFLLVLFVSGFVYVKWQYERWSNDIINAFPEIVQAGVDETGKPTLSPIDQIQTAYVAKRQAEAYWMFNMINVMLLVLVWRSKNPRKPQSFHIRGYNMPSGGR